MDQALPDVTAGEALKRAYEAEEELSRANEAKKHAKEEKDRWRFIAEAKLEEIGMTSGTVPLENGRKAMYYQVNKPKFDIINRDEVREWAANEDETYIDPEPGLRESLIFQECRRRHEEGLPLPPGIAVRTETEFHKKTL